MSYSDVVLTVIAVFILLDWLQDTELGKKIVYEVKTKVRKSK